MHSHQKADYAHELPRCLVLEPQCLIEKVYKQTKLKMPFLTFLSRNCYSFRSISSSYLDPARANVISAAPLAVPDAAGYSDCKKSMPLRGLMSVSALRAA